MKNSKKSTVMVSPEKRRGHHGNGIENGLGIVYGRLSRHPSGSGLNRRIFYSDLRVKGLWTTKGGRISYFSLKESSGVEGKERSEWREVTAVERRDPRRLEGRVSTYKYRGAETSTIRGTVYRTGRE